jgi:hypothetical protein
MDCVSGSVRLECGRLCGVAPRQDLVTDVGTQTNAGNESPRPAMALSSRLSVPLDSDNKMEQCHRRVTPLKMRDALGLLPLNGDAGTVEV